MKFINAKEMANIQPTKIEAMANSLISCLITNMSLNVSNPRGRYGVIANQYSFNEKVELNNLLSELGYKLDIAPAKKPHPSGFPMETFTIEIDWRKMNEIYTKRDE